MSAFEAFSSEEVAAGERRAAMHLVSSASARAALMAGERIPQFVLPEADGRRVDSRDLLASGPIVVSFIRGVWCPHSNRTARALEAARPEILRRGGTLVAIAPQSSLYARRMKRQNKAEYPLLVDAGGTIGAQFGVRWNVPSDLREVYRRIGVDLNEFNGEDGWALPMNALYVAGPDGVVAYAEVDPDFRRLIDPATVIPTLDRLHAQPTA